jgi:hypothetical protein
VEEVRQRQTAGMQGVLAANGDELFREGFHGFRFRKGGFDAAMLNQADHLVCKQRVAVGLGTAEFWGIPSVTHGIGSVVVFCFGVSAASCGVFIGSGV